MTLTTSQRKFTKQISNEGAMEFCRRLKKVLSSYTVKLCVLALG
ncbi:unnamed protein product [Moneuplotes crassus]|uniref:Uncharacterized protein n=1 Tax=Euplotes crassus TaxID=5936 RepID=A0AAD1XMT1_EUPCR|nr:unnamed protein product [Moneuplotes crassus]